MNEAKQTSELKICCECYCELKHEDSFCRQCGVRQPASYSTCRLNQTQTARQAQTNKAAEPIPLAVTNLSTADAFVRNVTTHLTAHASANLKDKLKNPATRTWFSALLAIPIWFVIVVLSPFDAYLAAKDAASFQ